MQTLKEGEKRTIEVHVKRRRGTGSINLTTPERRILDKDRALVAGFDWGAATWNSNDEILSALFDPTQAGLSAPGTYYLQLRGVIGADRPSIEITVKVQEWGP